MTDADLLKRFVENGSPEAFRELVRCYGGMVHAVALREVKDPHLAEDITQAVFLVLTRRAATLSSKVILGGWLFKTTIYAASDARRQAAARRHHEREASRMLTAHHAPDSAPQADELSGELNDALARLNAADRDTLILRFFQGQSASEVAVALGTTEVTARQRITRAVERLRKLLAGKGTLITAVVVLGWLDTLAAHAAPPDLLRQLEAVATGAARPTVFSESLAQGVTRMIRIARFKQTAAICAAVTTVALAVSLPLAFPQSAPQVSPAVAAAEVVPEVAVPEGEALKSAVDSQTAFAADLYQVLLKDHVNENLFMSPYSISSILGLTAAGSRGNTAAEMSRVLHLPGVNTMNVGVAALTHQLTDTEGGQRPYKLSIANSIWDSDRYPLVPSFAAMADKYYDTSGVFMTNFRGDPEGSRKKINQWVEDKTNAKIKELLPAGLPPVINPATALVLVNAIYFKGTWRTQFQAAQTRTEPFHISSGKESPTSLMHAGGSFQYYENEDFQMVSLPYTSARVPGQTARVASMLVILPRKPDGLAELERSITPEKLALWIPNLKYSTGSVALPKFTITCPITLGEILQGMGIHDAFNISKADFKNLAIAPPGEPLFISNVFHKAFVDVNEEGTEAAAATAVMMMGGGRPLSPFVFRADHPFFFAIRYEPTNSILFMGHLVNPTPPSASVVAEAPARSGGRRGPAVAGPAVQAMKDPKVAAATAIDLANAATKDNSFVSPNIHATLFGNLTGLRRAAQAVIDNNTADPTAVTARNNALSNAIANSANTAAIISVRPTESAEVRARTAELAKNLRELFVP